MNPDRFSLLVDNSPLSPELKAIRAKIDVGIEAVPAGSYQETNPYILLQSHSQVTALLPVEPQPEMINYLDWSQAGTGTATRGTSTLSPPTPTTGGSWPVAAEICKTGNIDTMAARRTLSKNDFSTENTHIPRIS